MEKRTSEFAFFCENEISSMKRRFFIQFWLLLHVPFFCVDLSIFALSTSKQTNDAHRQAQNPIDCQHVFVFRDKKFQHKLIEAEC